MTKPKPDHLADKAGKNRRANQFNKSGPEVVSTKGLGFHETLISSYESFKMEPQKKKEYNGFEEELI